MAHMQIDESTVRKVAQLARIALSDEQVAKFAGQLSNVFTSIEILNEVDTENVKPTNQVMNLVNQAGDDVVAEKGASREELLGCTELQVEDDQVLVMNTLK